MSEKELLLNFAKYTYSTTPIPYTGRGMYPDKTLGFTGKFSDLFSDLKIYFSKLANDIYYAESEEEKEIVLEKMEATLSLFEDIEIDDFGKEFVFYFPYIIFNEEELSEFYEE
ncbi:MAG: hypothetical protein QXX30_01670 [Candidatus Aenigmatarchaeota archaeon]